jgi:hypothetical protein
MATAGGRRANRSSALSRRTNASFNIESDRIGRLEIEVGFHLKRLSL